MNDASKLELHTEAKEVISKLQTRASRLLGHYGRQNGRLRLITGITVDDSGLAAIFEGSARLNYADTWTFVDCDHATIELGAR